MAIAGLINMLDADHGRRAVPHVSGLTEIDTTSTTPTTALGADARGAPRASLFGIALLASGLSSSTVGTMAGQVVMQGFIAPADPALRCAARSRWRRRSSCSRSASIRRARWSLSQVVLSFGIPFALIPLILFCANRSLMGELVNRRSTTVTAIVVATVIIGLNAFLLAGVFGLV